MKIQIEKSYLSNALSIAKRGISARSSMPVLSHVLLKTGDGQISLSCTDLDTLIQATAPAIVYVEGEVCIPVALFDAYISKLPNAAVTLELNEKDVSIRCAKTKLSIGFSPAKDFPEVPVPDVKNEISLPSATLKDLIGSVSFAASTEEHQNLLMGVLFEARKNVLTCVATDTHRLALKDYQLPNEVAAALSACIPAKPLKQLESFLKASPDETVQIRLDSSKAQFISSDAMMICRIFDGQYPNYAKVIPKQFERKVTFNRDALTEAMNRINLVSADASFKVLAQFTKSLLTLSTESTLGNRVVEEIEIEMTGSDLDIRFNSKFVLELLSHLSSDSLTWQLNGHIQPSMIVDGSFLGIVMPMQ